MSSHHMINVAVESKNTNLKDVYSRTEAKRNSNECCESSSHGITQGTSSSRAKAASDEIKEACMRTFTNRFQEDKLENLYQAYCSNIIFPRSRWLISFIIIVHLSFSLVFASIEGYTADGLDILPRSVSRFGEWFQWAYLLLAIPYALWPIKSTPYRLHWKLWITIIIFLLVIGLQIWLSYQSLVSTRDFKRVVKRLLNCTSTMPIMNDEYIRGYSIYDFVLKRDKDLYAVFIAVSSTLLAIVGTTLTVVLRLDFSYVLGICILCIISLLMVLSVYMVKQEVAMVCGYLFPAILLCLSSYYSDRAGRRSFLAKQEVEEENEALRLSLSKVEAACLLNDSARVSETLAVEQVLLNERASHLEHVRIPFSDLLLFSIIGSGGMGEIILADYLGTKVVCKRMLRDKISVDTVRKFREEVELMSCLRHPNIVQFIGASWDNCSNLCMVMEYLQNGDLHHVLHSAIGDSFTWSDPLLKLAIDAAQGMLYLHSQDPPVVHRDLKSVNLLCSATFGCKVTDFGLSKRMNNVDEDILLRTLVGTPYWLAPEIIRNEAYDLKVDIFSFGIVLTELETRKNPYFDQEETGIKVLLRVANGLRPTLPTTTLPSLRKLVESCLQDNSSYRPTFSEVLSQLQGIIREEIEEEAELLALRNRAMLRQHREKRQHVLHVIQESENI